MSPPVQEYTHPSASRHSNEQQQQSAPSWSDGSSCPVPHAKSHPLPPGHPPVPDAPASTLFPPTDSRCIFYRSPEDLAQTPPLSRSASSTMLSSTTTLPSLHELAVTHSASAYEFDKAQKLDQQRKEANINPLPMDREGQLGLDPACTLVLASRNSQLALVQSSHVSAMLEARYGRSSPLFRAQLDQTTAALDFDGHSSSLEPSTSGNRLQKVDKDHCDADLAFLRNLLQSFHTDPQTSLRSHTFPITSMSTAGDQNLRSPLYVIGGEGKAIWTKELEVALEQGAVDAIVHCLKDVPTALPNGLELAAVLEREDPRDALVVKAGLPYKVLDELPVGSVIGTSSVRRVAQLRRRYPHLVFSDVRGNINTRLAKLDAPNGPYTALILAAAGLVRLNFHSRITAFLSSPVLLHSVGQGSLAIEVRKPSQGADPTTNRDARIRELIRSIGDWRATFRAEAERALLKELEGGCSIPVGVETRFEDHDQVEGQRSEAIALVDDFVTNGDAVARADLPNGGVPLIKDGHTIPASQLSNNAESRSATPQRPPLESLATGVQEMEAAKVQAKTSDTSNATTIAEKIVSTSYSIVNRSTPASDGRTLHLDAIVVSLDGSQESRYSARKHCKTVEDARELGIHVAHELAHKKGARAILEEVERHRKMAEEADRRRREEARKRKSMGLPGGETNSISVSNGVAAVAESGDLNALKKSRDGWMRGQAEISLSTELEKMRQGSTPATGTGGDADAACDPFEMDRRGIPRDDGQPKAWEV
ncbi:related to HEM3 - porphobilinogen deaminase [Melanopsichium pennsylvanicum]|uniref:hydroxymethylbilane synthase n=2 Tax=Melanopsichium pennsylvanicum TaxID=63383 RepID=A0AAJ4XHK1_9BASI|nr:related to HEM3-porphobilinogen deaminase [Melanopsichium pennsylvanicum 4]SNX82519.1 related to HEM3 - porphobilinogen deaminase [Melanopsichium pennsylvanicum]